MKTSHHLATSRNRPTSRKLPIASFLGAVITAGLVVAACSTGSSAAESTVPPPTVPTIAPRSAEPLVSNVRTITVHGVGKKTQAPDQVTVTLGVETQAVTAAEALKANNAKAAELIKVLKARGVLDKNLQTSQLSVYPQFDNTGRKVTGYTVSNIVTATVQDISGTGALIDAAAGVAGDAIRVQNLSFSIADTSEALKTARERAVADAKTQAEQLAAAAGVRLGALRAISTSTSSVPVPITQQNVYAPKAADAGSVPIEAGSQEVRAEVDLVFEMA